MLVGNKTLHEWKGCDLLTKPSPSIIWLGKRKGTLASILHMSNTSILTTPNFRPKARVNCVWLPIYELIRQSIQWSLQFIQGTNWYRIQENSPPNQSNLLMSVSALNCKQAEIGEENQIIQYQDTLITPH